jgi:hypothetical protein
MKNKDLWKQDIEAMGIMNKKINELYNIIDLQEKEIKRLKDKKNIFKKIINKLKEFRNGNI